MCGLVGFLNFDRRVRGARQAQETVRSMAEAMNYRGPDMDGYWASGDNLCHLGHKRLSIVDLSAAPATSRCCRVVRSLVLVFNGEIYNFRDIQSDLEGSRRARDPTPRCCSSS